MGRILALDVGDRRIGVAKSDPMAVLANPFKIIKRTEEDTDIEAIVQMVDSLDIGRIIVGLPLSLDGSLGQQAEKVEAFTDKLRLKIKIPLEFCDERLSTVSARQLMRQAASKKTTRLKHDDAAAAAVILQGYLDEKRRS